MLVSSSVVIQRNAYNINHSSSGLLLSGSNHVLTSPVWLIRSTRQARQQGTVTFNVFLLSADNLIIKRDATLVTIISISKMVSAVQKLIKDASLPDADITRFCSIVVLQIQGAPLHCRDSELFNTRSPVTAGGDVYVRGTPFGDHHLKLFMNSTLVGCICGVLDDGVLFITDCVLPVGCEGAPLYSKATHSLIGLVLSPFTTKAGHPTGLSLCCSINAITSVLQCHISGADIPKSPALEQFTALHDGLVSVHTSSGAWGTGIVVKDGIVITCAHVIQQDTGPFTVKNQMGYQCSVIYCSEPGEVPDLAVLAISNFHASNIVPSPVIPSDYYSIGEAVAVISYGLLRPHDDSVGPLITKGAISKIIQHSGTPVMIQTTAVIAAGSSGGIVVSLDTGYPIGIVVSYTKDDTNRVTYPRLNFCVPLTLVWKPLSEYMITKDPAVFQRFYNEQLCIKEIWQLQPNMKPKL